MKSSPRDKLLNWISLLFTLFAIIVLVSSSNFSFCEISFPPINGSSLVLTDSSSSEIVSSLSSFRYCRVAKLDGFSIYFINNESLLFIKELKEINFLELLFSNRPSFAFHTCTKLVNRVDFDEAWTY